jgi:hypothetical protein
MLLDAGSERRSLLQRIETIGHCWARSRSRITARPFTSVGRFSPLGPRGTRIARFWRRRLSRGGRAHWQGVDRWMMSLSYVLARRNLHFSAVRVFDQHAVLINPTALDFANALRHRSPLFDYAFCAARAPSQRNLPRVRDRMRFGRYSWHWLRPSRKVYSEKEGERSRRQALRVSDLFTTRKASWLTRRAA